MNTDERPGHAGSRYFGWVVRWALPPILSIAFVLLLAPYLLPLTMKAVTPPKLEPAAQTVPERGFGLTEVIRGVRGDLIAAQNILIERQEAAMFQVDTFDIELSFVVKQSTSVGAEGNVPKFLVVSADSDYGVEQVQKIRLHLKVPEPPPAGVEVTDVPADADGAIELK